MKDDLRLESDRQRPMTAEEREQAVRTYLLAWAREHPEEPPPSDQTLARSLGVRRELIRRVRQALNTEPSRIDR